jgi:hypothetical protein
MEIDCLVFSKIAKEFGRVKLQKKRSEKGLIASHFKA